MSIFFFCKCLFLWKRKCFQGHLNLDVKEALATRADHFSLTISEDFGLSTTACLENKLTEICQMQEQLCSVIIVPPGKSMLLCFDHTQRKIALFESHKHGANGGLIAVSHYHDLSGFILYLENVFSHEWHTSIPGTNIAVFKKHIQLL